MRRSISSVTITDPLVKYQSLLATGVCSPDAAQHRLAIHLRKVYHRLKDYSPSHEYRARLKAITSALDNARKKDKDPSRTLAVESHSIWRNPLFTRFFARNESKDALALIKVLTNYEEAIQIDSPQGLFLSGEVGTGKSMLLDLLADGLPTSRKRRWHFNTFMLYTLSQLEHYRKSHSHLDRGDQEYSLLWMAKDMVEKSPILFLDEFQLPDRAASKILSNLFISFFQLGGVLVASSNRMPDELEKATGVDYVPPATGGFIGQVLGSRPTRGRGELFGSTSDFASFLEVLKARCEFWQMEGGKDWRRREASELLSKRVKNPVESDVPGNSPMTLKIGATSDTKVQETDKSNLSISTPNNYYLISETNEAVWMEKLNNLVLPPGEQEIPWKSLTVTVYGRAITIPQQYDGTVLWDFKDLVSSFGPADYITMASTFHTFIIDGVPILTILKKNEARRLITLLDALYEARCKLIIRAEAGPDHLFFPEANAVTSPIKQDVSNENESVDGDAIHSETFAEVYQDTMSPFRPNISSYTDSNNTDYDPDQDSDFGVEQKSKVDFSNTSAFTGEDERFAYKRATSRLWELCGAQWHSRTGDGWWQPLPPEARHWEGSPVSKPRPWTASPVVRGDDASMGPSVELEEPAGLQRLRLEYLRKAFSGEGQVKNQNQK
ncbi:AFG1-like ATPase-domain-containing protein [Daldinia caldariorum]|uniref:AFG1-like ATPase-domain-containing protein n=1 Tax=Daldinia caldariorum TaxID=326644 RepID=UPI0020088709|nr:AFG1-like ATPase-domain-containing protein [Daldinia caldariorum]KAI1468009.1 AFG1-like ATPase-domain-containing protein [Daldinia caldariorum]